MKTNRKFVRASINCILRFGTLACCIAALAAGSLATTSHAQSTQKVGIEVTPGEPSSIYSYDTSTWYSSDAVSSFTIYRTDAYGDPYTTGDLEVGMNFTSGYYYGTPGEDFDIIGAEEGGVWFAIIPDGDDSVTIWVHPIVNSCNPDTSGYNIDITLINDTPAYDAGFPFGIWPATAEISVTDE